MKKIIYDLYFTLFINIFTHKTKIININSNIITVMIIFKILVCYNYCAIVR
jgi:hypothetical protein